MTQTTTQQGLESEVAGYATSSYLQPQMIEIAEAHKDTQRIRLYKDLQFLEKLKRDTT